MTKLAQLHSVGVRLGRPITAATEKDGSSVDFTARYGANLGKSGLDPHRVGVFFFKGAKLLAEIKIAF